MQNNWYKEKENDKIWWLDNGPEIKGEFVFSFDQKKKYNLFSDYPKNMTKEEIMIFNKENPYWERFFRSRLL